MYIVSFMGILSLVVRVVRIGLSSTESRISNQNLKVLRIVECELDLVSSAIRQVIPTRLLTLKKEIRIDKLSESISILPSLESVAQPQQSSARFEPLKIDSATSPLRRTYRFGVRHADLSHYRFDNTDTTKTF